MAGRKYSNQTGKRRTLNSQGDVIVGRPYDPKLHYKSMVPGTQDRNVINPDPIAGGLLNTLTLNKYRKHPRRKKMDPGMRIKRLRTDPKREIPI